MYVQHALLVEFRSSLQHQVQEYYLYHLHGSGNAQYFMNFQFIPFPLTTSIFYNEMWASVIQGILSWQYCASFRKTSYKHLSRAK